MREVSASARRSGWQLSIWSVVMGWNLVVWLYLVCGVVAMAGVHSQRHDSMVDYYNYQPHEEEAVHSIMQSWVNAGTNVSFLTSNLGWSFVEPPCYHNETRAKNPNNVWKGLGCITRSYQARNNNILKYNALTYFGLPIDSTRIFGGLPTAILNLTDLELIFIANAIKLSGPLPQGIFCDHNPIRQIILRNCSFNGSISLGFGSDCGNNNMLKYLDLSWNSFTSINTHYFDNLEYLNVSNNKLKGKFFLGGFSMGVVDLSNNFLSNISISSPYEFLYATSFTSIFAQNNSIIRFPTEAFQSDTLQDIYLDSNYISSISKRYDDEHLNVSSLRKISMRQNLFQTFPEDLLQLPNLEEIILDFNNINGALTLPNISCKQSSIKLISLLFNGITHLYPSKTITSCFSKSSLLSDDKLFLAGNPICKSGIPKTELLLLICRYNASSPKDLNSSIVPRSNKLLLISMACISPIVVGVLIVAFCVIQKLRKKVSFLHELQNEFHKRNMKPNLYSFSELRVATQNFHVSNELGRGGFGIVYKGVLPDGSNVAVKKLTKLSVNQGIQEFLNEIIAVSNIRHRNLVQLKGCCIKENQRILVYEFVENENLANALWGPCKSDTSLDWHARFNIILGIARGLAYLHEEVQPAIIYRDIKGPNILLDKDCNPKIADFGLALFFPTLDDGETHMSVSKVAGTMGYMAPEYVSYGQVSTKLDVFSFGVLLLEIVSGRKNINFSSPTLEQCLVQWAQGLYANKNFSNLKDKSLKEKLLAKDVTFKRVVEVGLQCLHHVAARRPTMSEVVAMLIGNKKVDYCAFEDYFEGSSSPIDIESSNFTSARKFFLKSIGEEDGILDKQVESHKLAL